MNTKANGKLDKGFIVMLGWQRVVFLSCSVEIEKALLFYVCKKII